MKKRITRPVAFIVLLAIIALMLLVDRYTKYLAVENLSEGPVPFLAGVMDFHLVYNDGAAFGMFSGASPFFLIMAALATGIIIGYLGFVKKHSALEVCSLALIVSGAVGNAIDRLTLGVVVDFFHTLFIDFPVFNVADCCITVGVVLLMIAILFGRKEPQAE
jgi:signal peptidase II